MADLSVLIPARNEKWLSRTVEDVCANMRGDTDVWVILDGAWSDPGLPQHPKVNVVYLPEPIGQRAATNLAATLTDATYVMKLDAHCSLGEGFDVVLMDAAKELGETTTQIPAQRNLHILDYVCDSCGRREYQTPPRETCAACNQPVRTEMVWKPRGGTTTTCWTFTAEPKFQYGGTPKREIVNGIGDVMSSLGACFFMSRDRFWQLGGLDESHGSWGSFGIEIACKSWLSGGRHVVNTRTWFAHFFRVGGHGFPYPLSGAEQERARTYSRNLWLNDAWPGQVKPLRWLLGKFWPVAGWTDEQRESLPGRLVGAGDVEYSGAATSSRTGRRTAGVVWYSDCRPDPAILKASQRSVEASGLPIVAVTLKPIDGFAAKNIVLPLERGYLTMFRQILAGLEALDTDVVFFAEHDVLYDASHFTFVPPRDDVYYYNESWVKVDVETGRAVSYTAKQLSQLCANRQLLIEHYRKRIAITERDGFTRAQGFEPGSHRRKERIDDVPSDVWRSAQPNLDLRHRHNLTPSRWTPDAFRDKRNCQDWRELTIELPEELRAQQAVA